MQTDNGRSVFPWTAAVGAWAVVFGVLASPVRADNSPERPHPAGTAFATTTLVSASLAGTWRITEGASAIRFNRKLMAGLGIQIVDTQVTARTQHTQYLGFSIVGPSQMRFTQPGGALDGLADSMLTHAGGLVLSVAGQRIDMRGFRFEAGAAGVLNLTTADGRVLFTLANAHTYRDALAGQLYVMQMDLRVSHWLAGYLGTPEFTDQIVGVVDLIADIVPVGGSAIAQPAAGECIADFGDGAIDLMLTALDGISSLALDGTTVAFAPSAKLRNVGSNDVRWYWAIEPPGFNGPNVGVHPFLSMHFYRITNDVIEQVAQSDLKHAWNTVNNDCPCPSGQVMYVGCEDTYGVSNNGNQFYFGPREELDANTAQWTSLGSHFDATPVDDTRDHGFDSGDHGVLDHRLQIDEAELQVPGSEYVVEAWYIAQGDVDILNSMAHRRVTQQKIGNTWSFSFADSQTTNGPAIDLWVSPDSSDASERHTTRDTGVGLLKLAVKVTDLGGGQFHYEYALMNLDFDRQVNRFSIPVLAGAVVENMQFGDGDADLSNDWSMAQGDGLLTWSAPPASALDWGTLVNFRMQTNVPPATAAAALIPLEAGSNDNISTLTLAPAQASGAGDTDSDGLLDSADNCVLVANPDQRDSDGDFFGNACDADLNNDGEINFIDLSELKAAFFSSGDVAGDLDGDGEVNFQDLAVMKGAFFTSPGPSGVGPAAP